MTVANSKDFLLDSQEQHFPSEGLYLGDLTGGDTDVERMCLKDVFPDIYDILDKACYRATLDAYNEYLRSCGKPEVDKLDFEHEVNIPYEFTDLC